MMFRFIVVRPTRQQTRATDAANVQ